MDSQAIERLQASFALLAPRAEMLADTFYRRLFAQVPAVRELFPDDLSTQQKKLVAALVMVVRNLRTPEALREPLLEMGERHAGYGAKPEHYPVVRDTLIGTLAALTGDTWNDQLAADWRSALDSVANVMLEGHRLAVSEAS